MAYKPTTIAADRPPYLKIVPTISPVVMLWSWCSVGKRG
jgi:hypothetical protein